MANGNPGKAKQGEHKAQGMTKTKTKTKTKRKRKTLVSNGIKSVKPHLFNSLLITSS